MENRRPPSPPTSRRSFGIPKLLGVSGFVAKLKAIKKTSTHEKSGNATDGPVPPIEVDVVVTVDSAVAHLGLLHRFSVLEDKDDQFADWAFLCRAEERYLLWLDLLKKQRPDPDRMPLPPLDVAMMWHAHMLNPLRYLEDCYFIFGGPCRYAIPFLRMHALPGVEYNPDDGSKEAWVAFTNTPFTVSLSDGHLFNLTCIWCSAKLSLHRDSFVKLRMKNDSIKCGNCKRPISADNISAKRFLSDVSLYGSSGQILKGTALDEVTGAINVAKAKKDLSAMFSSMSAKFSGSTTINWAHVEDAMRTQFELLRATNLLKNVRKSTMPKIFRAYKNITTHLTLDLVAAVIRQRGFTGKMVGGFVNWTERDTLARATIRYQMFLDLTKKEPNSFLVPTLDVDLMWHTHQCYPQRYQNYGLREMKRIINHDDSVESKVLSTSFESTSSLWKHYFNEIYSPHAGNASTVARTHMELIFPPYVIHAASNAVTITKPAKGDGNCGINDPTPLPARGRRSQAKHPVGAPVQAVDAMIRGRSGVFERARVLVGGCFSCASTCSWMQYGNDFHPWGHASYIQGPLFWGGGDCGAHTCGALAGCGSVNGSRFGAGSCGGCGTGGLSIVCFSRLD
ncbi:hypothetical protein BDR26DRAFT_570941 [Obelidium mucronatum]|nr:hypothetical protein BDR26DRAFT_570941 [Obelidium mucronatum]